METFIKGLILGFSIAAPVGPIGLLCIRRTLTEGKIAGFISGLGAASADAIYGFIAAFSLVIISSFLIAYELPIKLIGAIFLFYLAIRIIIWKPTSSHLKSISSRSYFRSYISTFFLTLSNPSTIISFIGAFAAIGSGAAKDGFFGSLIVVGVFLGSAIWWLVLSLLYLRNAPRVSAWDEVIPPQADKRSLHPFNATPVRVW